jgi:hypothetical protein
LTTSFEIFWKKYQVKENFNALIPSND